jgi:hypothetical protein
MPPASNREKQMPIVGIDLSSTAAPQLAEWMKRHPVERLAAWRCVIGKRDGRGA